MKRFLDTNVLVYAYDDDEPAKQAQAQHLIADLWARHDGAISIQVLQEFVVTVTTKWRDRIDAVDARAVIEAYDDWRPFSPETADVVAAIDVVADARISFWDALVVVAAKRSGAGVLLSEDLNHGQLIEGVRIENPFL